MNKLPENYKCENCGKEKYTIWFTSNELWNEIMKSKPEALLCLGCFMEKAESHKGRGIWEISRNHSIK